MKIKKYDIILEFHNNWCQLRKNFNDMKYNWYDIVLARFSWEIFNFKDVSSWSKELLYDSDDDFNMYDWEFIFQLGLLGIILVFRVKK